MCLSKGQQLAKGVLGSNKKKRDTDKVMETHTKELQESSVGITQCYKGAKSTDTVELERAALLHVTQMHGFIFIYI